MHYSSIYLVHFLTLLSILLPQKLLPQPPFDTLQQGIAMGINQQFEDALHVFSKIESDYPQHPAGPFFKAAIYQSMMLDYESHAWKDLFYQHIEKSIALAEAQLKQNEDLYASFYLGAAYIFKSSQLARDQKYLASLFAAKKGLGILRPLLHRDSTFCDPYLGIGTYDFWRSKFTLMLSWLPFFPDRRAEGIAAVKKSAECSLFSRWAAYSNLCWIYIKEENYDAAIDYALRGLQQFPQSRFFLWPLAEAEFKKGDYVSAIADYEKLLKSIQSEKINNHYNEIVIHWKLAQAYRQLGNHDRARQHCRWLLALQPDEFVRERAKDKQKAAQKMLATLEK